MKRILVAIIAFVLVLVLVGGVTHSSTHIVATSPTSGYVVADVDGGSQGGDQSSTNGGSQGGDPSQSTNGGSQGGDPSQSTNGGSQGGDPSQSTNNSSNVPTPTP